MVSADFADSFTDFTDITDLGGGGGHRSPVVALKQVSIISYLLDLHF